MGEEKSDLTARGPYAGGLARREKILDVTDQLVAEVGYHGLSMRDVARRVGISHPGVIYHFPTKEALLMAVIQRHEARFDLNLNEMSDVPPRELIRRFLQNCQELVADPIMIEMECMLMVEGASDLHPAHDHYVRRTHRMQLVLTDAVQELQDEGVILKNTSAEELAYMLVSMGVGLHLMWLYNQDNPMCEPVNQLTQVFVRHVNLSTPEGMRFVLSLGASSQQLLRTLETVKGKTILQMIKDGDLQVDADFLRPYGLDQLPPELVQRVIDSGLLTAEYATYSTQHHGVSLELLGKLVGTQVIDKHDLEAVAETGLVSPDVIRTLQAIAVDWAPQKGEKPADLPPVGLAAEDATSAPWGHPVDEGSGL